MVLNRYLLIYLNLFNPDSYPAEHAEEFDFEKIYKLITQSKKKNPLYPAIYFIYDALKLDKNGEDKKFVKQNIAFVKTTIYEIVKILIGHDIVSGQGDSGTARAFGNITYNFAFDCEKKFENTSSLIQAFVQKLKSDVAIRAGDGKAELSTVSKPSGAHKALLILIEGELLGGIMSDVELNYNEPSGEHVMPQNLANWKLDLKKGNNQMTDDEILENHNSHVHKLGNAIRLPRNWNSKIKNFTLTKKLQTINDIANFISPLFKNDNDKIDISRKSIGNFSDIDSRHSQLLKIIEEKIFRQF